MKCGTISETYNEPGASKRTTVFSGTQIPVQTLCDHVKAGGNLDDFLQRFHNVSREEAISEFEIAQENIIEEEIVYEFFA